MLLCMLTLHWDSFWYTGAALGAFWLAHPAQLFSDSEAVLTHRRPTLCKVGVCGSHVPEHSLLTRPAELVHYQIAPRGALHLELTNAAIYMIW